MASIHRKSKNGVWHISYRQGGILNHRSLESKSAAEARRLKKEIDLKVQANPNIEIAISERPKASNRDPKIEIFWSRVGGLHYRYKSGRVAWANTT